MGRRKGQSWFNYIGNSIPIVKLFVKGENSPDDALTNTIKNAGYNLNSSANGGASNTSGMKQMNPYIGAGIGAAANIAGSYINANATKSVNEQQIAHNMQMYNLSREDALKMWQIQNDYNSPSEQMKRLREAGLNPHLVYGNGADTTAGAISTPQAHTANLQVPQYGDMVNGIGSYISLMAAQAGIEKTKAETDSIRTNTEGHKFDNAVKVSIGYDRAAQSLDRQMAAMDSKSIQTIREFDAWMTASFGSQISPSSDQVNIDAGGSYFGDDNAPIVKHLSAQYQSNDLINKAKKAGIDKTAIELTNLRKKGVLYDDQHTLNQIDIKIKNFAENLTQYGISPQSSQFLSIMVGLLRTVFNK